MSRPFQLLRAAFAAVALAVVSACVRAPAPAPAIHVLRHFDTPAGERDPDLTEAGKRRAAALAGWFAGKPLGAIYVTDTKRARATAAPLAAARGIEPQTYNPADPVALITTARAITNGVLIVGHSNTVPDLVERLGGTRPQPLTHADFGDIWTITAAGTERGRVDPKE